MPDPIDDGRDALGDAHPTRDLWADASARAERADEVPLAPAPARSTRPRWLAVAALLALVTGTVAALSLDDDGDDVRTTPATTPGEGTTSTSIFPSEGCFFAVSGDPIGLTPGAGDPPLFDPAFQPEGVTAAHGALGDTQVVEVQVPGVVVTDLVGERVDEVELERGTASIWFGPDFVQVRWFPGTEEPCDSFTVTVAGSTEDGNRHAAVALADRLLLPTEIGVEEPPGSAADLLQGDWQLERSTVDGEPTDGGGLVFSFEGDEASWSDGCNSFAGTIAAVGVGSVAVPQVSFTDATQSLVDCPFNATMEAVDAVMSADSIDVSSEGDELVLRAGTTELRLRRLARLADRLIGTEWILESYRVGDGALVEAGPPGRPDSLTFTFGSHDGEFWDGCNSLTSSIVYGAQRTLTLGAGSRTQKGCDGLDPAQTATVAVVLTSGVEASFTADGRLELIHGDAMLVLRPA